MGIEPKIGPLDDGGYLVFLGGHSGCKRDTCDALKAQIRKNGLHFIKNYELT